MVASIADDFAQKRATAKRLGYERKRLFFYCPNCGGNKREPHHADLCIVRIRRMQDIVNR